MGKVFRKIVNLILWLQQKRAAFFNDCSFNVIIIIGKD